jgi:hypothetical protein
MFNTVTAVAFFYVGVIVGDPPTVDGKTLLPDQSGEIVYSFTPPESPCAGSDCEQEVFRVDKNPKGCWVYEDVSLESGEPITVFTYRPIVTDDRLELRLTGNATGRSFVFRAHLKPRCAPST